MLLLYYIRNGISTIVKYLRQSLLSLFSVPRVLFSNILRLYDLLDLLRQGILHRDLKPTNILLSWPDNSNRFCALWFFFRSLHALEPAGAPDPRCFPGRF